MKTNYFDTKSYAFCPISDKKVNQSVAKIVALFTLLFLGIFALTLNFWVILFLTGDFLLRSTSLAKYSPIGYISCQIALLFSLKERPINAGPKIFAARVGFVITLLIFSFYLLSFHFVWIILLATISIFAFLEGVFEYCVACKIYPFVYKVFYRTN
jgi:hypothetical protein